MRDAVSLCVAKATVFTVIQLQAEEDWCSPVEMELAEAMLWVHCWTLGSLEKFVFGLLCMSSAAGVPVCALGKVA